MLSRPCGSSIGGVHPPRDVGAAWGHAPARVMAYNDSWWVLVDHVLRSEKYGAHAHTEEHKPPACHAYGCPPGAAARVTGRAGRMPDARAAAAVAKAAAQEAGEGCAIAHKQIQATRGVLRPELGGDDITVHSCAFHGPQAWRFAEFLRRDLAPLEGYPGPGLRLSATLERGT